MTSERQQTVAAVSRSVLLAAALVFVYPGSSFAAGIGGGGGTAPTQPPAQLPASANDIVGGLFNGALTGEIMGAKDDFDVEPLLARYMSITVASLRALGLSPVQAASLNNAIWRDRTVGLGPATSGENFGLLASQAPGVALWAGYVESTIRDIITVQDGETPSDPAEWQFVVQQASDLGITPLQQLQSMLQARMANLLYYLGVTQTYYGVTHAGSPTGPLYGRPLYQFAEEEAHGFPPAVADAYAALLHQAPPSPPPSIPFRPQWSVWSSGFGGYNRTTGTAGGPALTVRGYGGAAGAEYRLAPGTALGLVLGGGSATWNGGGTGRSNVFQYGVYGRTRSGPAYLAGWLDGSVDWTATNSLAGGDAVAADYVAQTYGGRLEGGYRYTGRLPIGVTPYAAVQLQYTHTPAYSETDFSGGGMGFRYNASDGTDTRSELGVKFDASEFVSAGTITWSAQAAWAHDWLTNFNVVATSESTPTVGFTVNGAALLPKELRAGHARWRSAADLGLEGRRQFLRPICRRL